MASSSQSQRFRLGISITIWSVFLVFLAYFLYDSVSYRFFEPGNLGPSLFNKQIWFWLHFLLAAPALTLAPIQFSSRFRSRWPQWHRRIGKTYVCCALGAALTASYLGATYEIAGARIPLVLLSVLWATFTGFAWLAAARRDFTAHRLFMMRSFNAALAFLWIRVLALIPNSALFPFLATPVAQATREWVTDTIPLIILELWLVWWPLIHRSKRRGDTIQGNQHNG